MDRLTKKQEIAYKKACENLPSGYTYSIHDECEQLGKYRDIPITGAAWAISVYDSSGNELGIVFKSKKMQTYGIKSDITVNLLSRVAAYVWHF